MNRNDWEHPEQSYRRGFQQGAHAVWSALEKGGKLDKRTIIQCVDFVYYTVFHWRYAKQRRLGRHLHRDAAPSFLLKKGI
jgi:hypothetical protein